MVQKSLGLKGKIGVDEAQVILVFSATISRSLFRIKVKEIPSLQDQKTYRPSSNRVLYSFTLLSSKDQLKQWI